ncbi:MAG: Hpt domain-containing protein [Bacillota bacterium]
MADDDQSELRQALAALRPEIRQMLAEDLPVDRERSEEAYAACQWAKLREQVHRVKGSASFCRLSALKSACMRIEEQVAEGNPPDREAMDTFSAEISRVLTAFEG